MEIPNETPATSSQQHISQLIATPDNPPWNSPVAIGLWLASVAAIVVTPVIFVGPYIVSKGPDFSQREALGQFLQSDPTAILLQIIAVFPAHIITLALTWAVITRFRKYSFRDVLGWASGGMQWWHYVLILGGFFVVAGVVGTYFPEQENELTRILRSSRTAVYLVAIMATFTAPLVEEVIYRGVVYSALQRTFGAVLAVVSVTLLFAMVHVPQYYPSFSTIGLLLLLSLILTLVRVYTANLLPCIILHTVFNAIQAGTLILEPYVKTVEPVIQPSASAILR